MKFAFNLILILYVGTKKMTFFCFIIWDGGSRPYYIVTSYEMKVPLFESLEKLSFMNFNTLVLFRLPPICSLL